jgi:hypothetical protein
MHSPDCFGLLNRRTPAIVGKAQGPRAHVLVCAPSNAALDEVVLRILQHGLLDGTGQRYDPSIVRIGVNVHHSVKSVSLEKLVDAKLGVTDRVSRFELNLCFNQSIFVVGPPVPCFVFADR